MRVSERSAKELALLRDQPSTQIAEVLSQLSAAKKPIVSPRVMRSLFEKSLEKEAARVLVKQLIALGHFIRHTGVQPAETVESLTLGLQSPQWTPADIDRWNAFAPQLQKLLETNHVAILVKAVDISYDFEHNYQEARILTDIRPIYDAPRAKIVGAMVCYRLRLSYSESNADVTTMSIAMDRKEVEKLRSACEEALEKGNAATDLITKKAELELFVGGEEADESFGE
jgi:hypothetical protein